MALGNQRWRKLVIVLMFFFSLIEIFIALVPGIGNAFSNTFHNHWVDHIWLVVMLFCTWSFPYPLVLALIMMAVGWLMFRGFNWNKRREPLIWWITVALIVCAGFLVLEGLFRESSPSKAVGIENAFAQAIPSLMRNTVEPGFAPSKPGANESPLGPISKKIMEHNGLLLKRDLVITTSKLPMRNTKSNQLVNSLPDDLYFYFRKNADDKLKPPPDKHFVPFKHNPDKLLDVVIGSSTIYPVFPSRLLKEVWLGNEESKSQQIPEMRIIDGGFIHNIPIEAASAWGATHIILIEASPMQQQGEPRDLWDNVLTAFGYLFSQAQRTDTLARGAAETFDLRPTSLCEKENIKPVCTDDEGGPEPNMDTFDFSPYFIDEAFRFGAADAGGMRPLFMRVPGPPQFRIVAAGPYLEP